MKYILIVGAERLIVGPFDCADDAISYALNVLDSDSYSVNQMQTPITVENFELMQHIGA